MKTKLIILSLAASTLLLGSCVKEFAPETEELPAGQIDQSEISAVCLVDTRTESAGTKSAGTLIDQITTRQLSANFLRIDEEVGTNHLGLYTFYNQTAFVNASTPGTPSTVNWEKAYLSEATLISSPDNTEGIHYRSILFTPKMAYNILANMRDGTNEIIDTTKFYHTRMVGWYPRNCNLQAKYQYFSSTKEQNETYQDASGNVYKAVKFTGLDGSQDLMMSNVCEGQHWHSANPANSPYTNEADNLPYRVPFGHYIQFKDPTNFHTKYSNYFKFRHYLSGVRFWGFVPEQNTHALDMWGNITDVVLLNQPTSVSISLPEEPLYDANGNSLSWAAEESYWDNPRYWGQPFNWGDEANFSVQTGAMFGDDSNHADEAFTVDFSKIDMHGVGDIEHALYLGYSLVKPDGEVEVEIHTRYGVYVTTIKPTYTYKYKENGVEKSETIKLFQPGYYYDVYLSLETDGTISAIIESRGTEHYYDLTRSVTVNADTGEAIQNVTSYKYANSYIVDPTQDVYDTDSDGVCDYSGFFFSGMVPGNGEAGIFTYNSQSFYPSSAKLNPVYAQLIWESSRLLVSDVELVNGYVKFKVPGINDSDKYSSDKSTYNGTKGNAVIGVFDDDNNCLWSWHIWVTDTPKTVAYNNNGRPLYFMDRNMGATRAYTTSNAEILDTYGLYYQWGRKDPSMGPSEYNYSVSDASTATYYDYASDEQNTSVPMSLNYPSLKDAVENPMYLLLPIRKSDKGFNYDWLYMAPENILWGHNHNTGTTSKTIYDPCPFGWRVPSGELDAVMSNSTYTAGTRGLSFTGGITDENGNAAKLFFPYAGYKGKDKGMPAVSSSWSYVGSKGDYQEGVYNTSNTTGEMLYGRRRFYISSTQSWTEHGVLGAENYYYGNTIQPISNGNNIYKDFTNRRTAASVRCVKDAEFATVSVSATPAKAKFSAKDAVVISFDALASASTLTNVTVIQSYTLLEDSKKIDTELYNLAPGSASWHQVYTFNAPSAEFLATTDGIYSFKITATSDYGITESSTIVLATNQDNVIMMPSSKELAVGETYSLNASLKFQSGQTISYVSSDPKVATVDANGNIKGVGRGNATITATASETDDWASVSATCNVVVVMKALISVPGEVFIPLDSATPIGATITSNAPMSYSSDDTSIVTVDSDGNLTGHKLGTAHVTISAGDFNNYLAPETKVVTVKVVNQAIRTLNIEIPDLEVGGNANTLSPSSATLPTTTSDGQAISYSIDDINNTVSFNQNTGELTAVNLGTVSITYSVAQSDNYMAFTSNPVEVMVYAYKRVKTVDEFTGSYGMVFTTTNNANNMYILGWGGGTTAEYTAGKNVVNVNGDILTGVPKANVMYHNADNSYISAMASSEPVYYLGYDNSSSTVVPAFSTTGNEFQFEYWSLPVCSIQVPYVQSWGTQWIKSGLKSANNNQSITYAQYGGGVYVWKRVCE